jgi:hypothetical protein
MIFDILAILGVFMLLMNYGIGRGLSSETIAMLLVGTVALRAAARALNVGLIRLAFSVGLPLISLALFFHAHGGADSRIIQTLVGMFGVVAIQLVGIYIMFYGLFRSGRRR